MDLGGDGCPFVDVPDGASTLWATIYAYSIVEDTTITCSTEDSVGLIRLFDGQAATPISLSAGTMQTFQLAAPPGENVICETRLLSASFFADADLYVSSPYDSVISTKQCILTNSAWCLALLLYLSRFVSMLSPI